MNACESGKREIVNLLLQAKADISLKDTQDRDALLYAQINHPQSQIVSDI